MNRAAGRRAFDLLERRLAPVATWNPGLALRCAERLGRLRNRLSRRWPSPEQVHALFPQLTPGAAARVAWRIGGLEARNRLLVTCLRRSGLDWLRPLVRVPEEIAMLRPPLILGTFHVGALNALGPAFERLANPVLVFRQSSLYQPRPPVELETTDFDDQRRAASFHRALLHLEGGGFLVVALDLMPEPGPGLRVPCLGRELELARGPFALARLTGAPLMPIVARWRRGEVEVAIGEALASHRTFDPAREPAAWESAVATSAARWLERYLLDSPAELGLGLLRDLLGNGIRSEACRT